MTRRVQTLVALDSAVDRQAVEKLLTSSPQLEVVDYDHVDTGVGREGGDVVVVACGGYSHEVANYVEQALQARSERPVVLLAPSNSNGYVADAFAHGADDIVILPDVRDSHAMAAAVPQIAFALEKALARKRGVAMAVAHGLGEMICVLGLKGGSGKTLTVANLAVALADAGQRVAVVDLDLQFGDTGLALGLTPERTMYDLVRAGGSLDAGKVAGFMETHACGAHALLAPTRPDHASVVTPEFLGRVYQVLRESHDFVLIDTPAGFTPEVIAAVDASSSACVVATLDSLSLKNTKLGFETLELMDYDSDRIEFVLNRADSHVGISHDDVVTITGRSPSIHVPSDRNVARSVNMGQPIAISGRRSDAARAFHALAATYIGQRDGKRPHEPRHRRPKRHREPRHRRRLFRRR
jgi:pilus assembly protein CpaE